MNGANATSFDKSETRHPLHRGLKVPDFFLNMGQAFAVGQRPSALGCDSRFAVRAARPNRAEAKPSGLEEKKTCRPCRCARTIHGLWHYRDSHDTDFAARWLALFVLSRRPGKPLCRGPYDAMGAACFGWRGPWAPANNSGESCAK